jgi:excisionase family DNA binding protein
VIVNVHNHSQRTPTRSLPPALEVAMEEKLLLTVDEAARRLGIGRSHAYVFVLRGEIESVKIGRSRRVPVEAIEQFVDRLRAEQQDG